MLARLSMATSSMFDVRIDSRPTGISISEDETIIVDVDCLRDFVAPLQSYAWQRVSETMAPMYKTVHCIHDILRDDSERVAELLLQLEMGTQSGQEDMVQETSEHAYTNQITTPRTQFRETKHSMPSPETTLHCSSNDLGIPIIIVTPCSPQRRDTSSCTPFQDSGFRTQLVVPGYFTANESFPPMVQRPAAFMVLKGWRWQYGHWKAILPSLDEQHTRGLFARSTTPRKRACRTPQHRRIKP